MTKAGKAFENLTAEIFTSLRNSQQYENVEQDVMLDGVDCPRQIDILLRGKVGPFENITIIECKDYNKKIDITKIDELHSKMQDVRAQKAVLVSRKGFSKNAIRKAQRLGVSLCTAHSANNEKWKFDLELPFLICEHSLELVKPYFQIIPGSYSTEDIDVRFVNGVHLHQIVGEYWNQHGFNDGTSEIIITESEDDGFHLRTNFGEEIKIHRLTVELTVKKSHYFGYFNNLESAKLLRYIEQGDGHVVFDINELANYREKAVLYDCLTDVPKIKDTITFSSKVIINPKTELLFKPSVRKVLLFAKPNITIS